MYVVNWMSPHTTSKAHGRPIANDVPANTVCGERIESNNRPAINGTIALPKAETALRIERTTSCLLYSVT